MAEHAAYPYHAGYDQADDPCIIGMQPTGQTVVVNQQPVSNMSMIKTRGTDLTIYAVFVCIFCNCCFGIPAIVYAFKAQDNYSIGLWEEAESNQRWARIWIIVSMAVFVTMFIVLNIIVWTTSLYFPY